MHVGILGPLEVRSGGGGAVSIGGARLRALLVRLALDPGRLVTHDELAEALWGAAPPADRANALQSLVSRLRRVLPDPGVLRSEPGGYRLALPKENVDAHRFAVLAARGHSALASGDHRQAAACLGEAAALWRGRPLADVADAPFADAAVSLLDEARLAATEDRLDAEIALGGAEPLVSELRDLAARHPLRERVHALLMRALAASGRRAEALTAFEEVRHALADDLGVDPGPELREAHLAVLREEPATRRGRPAMRAPLTSFVGRDHDMAEIARRLADSRLVTLVGPGGAGKTRLASTVAARLDRPVWLVELAPVTNPDDVPQAVLTAVGAGQTKVQDGTVSRIVEVLSGGESLLLLDNCEHLIDAAARLADELLGLCPRLTVLATSREALGIFGESLWPVPPLADEPAVRLFLDRAEAVRPGFALTPENTPVVTEICRRLDGLPLAIELAAARLRSLTVDQVAARLDDRFRLLTGGSRTAMARHQTLRAVVAWSWDLLGDDERDLAERLAVFPGGFTAEAAEAVGGSLDLLAALVDRSLLQLIDGPRYRMLETIREYGLERLAERGEVDDVRSAHTRYFLDLAEQGSRQMHGHGQLTWIRILGTDHDNLLAAFHYAIERDDARTATRLTAALGTFWMITGRRSESVPWLKSALDLDGEADRDAWLVTTMMYLLNSLMSQPVEDVDGLIARFGEISQAADIDDDPLLCLVTPIYHLFKDDVEGGLAAIDRAFGVADTWSRAMLLLFRGFMRENEGDPSGQLTDLRAAAAGFREVGDRWGLAQALTFTADAAMLFGDFDLVVKSLEEAIELTKLLNPDDEAGHQRMYLATARSRQGDVDGARHELQLMADASRSDWSIRDAAFSRIGLGDLAREVGDLEEARIQYEQASLAIDHSGIVSPQFRALVLTCFGHLTIAEGDAATAAAVVAEAAELADSVRDRPVLARVGVLAAEVEGVLGNAEGAARLLGASEQLRGAPDAYNPDVFRISAQLRETLGDEAYFHAYGSGAALDRAAAIDQVLRR
ncbi:BTAD domain-containing putative transcriptional regulator [Herbidospora sp. RD11066]